MTHEIIPFAEDCFRLLLSPSSKAAVLAVIALGLTFALRRWVGPRWRHLLWVLVFARLLTPDLGSWQWSVQRWHQDAPVTPERVVMMAAAETERETRLPVAVVERREEAAFSHAEAVTGGSVAALAVEESSRVEEVSWEPWRIAGMIWLAGVLGMLALMRGCALAFHRRVMRGAVPAGDEWQSLLAEMQAAHGWRRVPELLVSSARTGTLLAGFWRPRIVLGGDAESLSSEERRHLLRHELAHWRRGDIWWQTAASLLLALHWFNPLLWLAHHRLRAESEACADAWALRRQDARAVRAYGGTLLRLAGATSSILTMLLTPGMLGMASGGGELRERLAELARGPRRKRGWAVAALLLVAFAAAVSFTRPALAQAQAQPSPREAGVKTRVIEGSVADENGRPLSGVAIRQGEPEDYLENRPNIEHSDREGRFRLEVPEGSTEQLSFFHSDYMSQSMRLSGENTEPLKVTLPSKRLLQGRVTAEGKAVEGARVFVADYRNRGKGGERFDGVQWSTFHMVQSGREGRYSFHLNRDRKVFYLRVEAEGYHTLLKSFEVKEPVIDLDLPLIAVNPDPERQGKVRGAVLDAQGRPVKGAFVAVAEGNYKNGSTIDAAWIEKRFPFPSISYDGLINQTRSGDDGRFELKRVPQVLRANASVIAANAEGFGRTPLAEWEKKSELRLEPWNSLQARFVDEEGKPWRMIRVQLRCQGTLPGEGGSRLFQPTKIATTDLDGRVAFTQIPPHCRVEVACGYRVQMDKIGFTEVFAAGEAKEATIEVAKGALALLREEDREKMASWRRVTGAVALPEGSEASLADVKGFVLGTQVRLRSSVISCDEKGRFVIAPLPPGRYTITFHLPGTSSMSRSLVLFLPKAHDGSDFDVGKIELTGKPKAKPLPAPKGATGSARLRVIDEAGQPVSGAEIAYTPRRTDDQYVPTLDMGRSLPKVMSDANGEAALDFATRSDFGIVVAGVAATIRKAGYVTATPATLADGASETVTLRSGPAIAVRAESGEADVWVTAGSYGGEPERLQREGGILRTALAISGKTPWLLTDQSDARAWRFSKLMVSDFEPGKTVNWEGEWETGVVIEGKVAGLSEPVSGDVWAYALVELEDPPGEDFAGLGPLDGSIPKMNWRVWSPVSATGEFRFAGVPRGQLMVRVVGPGWIAAEPEPKALALPKRQLTAEDKVLKLEMTADPVCSRRVQVIAPDGSPAKGARLYLMGPIPFAPLAGAKRKDARAHVAAEHREAFRQWQEREKEGSNELIVDEEGFATIENQPAGLCFASLSWVDPETRQMRRHAVQVDLKPGENPDHRIEIGLLKPAP